MQTTRENGSGLDTNKGRTHYRDYRLKQNRKERGQEVDLSQYGRKI